MRIVTWNVNSLRTRLPRLLELLAEPEPDIARLQETKSMARDVARGYRKGAEPSDHVPLVADLA